MAVVGSLAMLQRNGCWLMQLRDGQPGIVAPGCWGLFGGHLEGGEPPEQALRQELLEEIGWQPPAHGFRAALSVPLEQLRLLEVMRQVLATAD